MIPAAPFRLALLALLPCLVLVAPAHAIDLCKGGKRAERKATCVVDGDTIWQQGVKMRLLDIDAPEMSGECQAEKLKAREATARLVGLMSKGYRINDSGKKDRTSDRRSLIRIRLPDGRDAGKVLVREGLAQRWPNVGNIWCSASHMVQ
ncbi:endonuclease YncB(thermonuclease family) [Rhizobium sp. PP-F2F-G48]|uniref:thermonuclease family protein n=1 Tax=Rhizobium sp. PP-F2F-G48 TaxID=2135651 RepID=UPI001047AAC1|nr:thermonuclease family protein [Rhizobium sp. PP-F2F-G48]TCM54955.1 endonuclease YncB(thermonuclease family) [Rhizobium sp. PP-F2F-G48]